MALNISPRLFFIVILFIQQQYKSFCKYAEGGHVSIHANKNLNKQIPLAQITKRKCSLCAKTSLSRKSI